MKLQLIFEIILKSFIVAAVVIFASYLITDSSLTRGVKENKKMIEENKKTIEENHILLEKLLKQQSIPSVL